jgi:hypothetical protein
MANASLMTRKVQNVFALLDLNDFFTTISLTPKLKSKKSRALGAANVALG